MKYRCSKKYTILAGLWFSKQKPTMTTYLRPLVNKLNYLYTNGKHCRYPSTEPVYFINLCTQVLKCIHLLE